LTEQARIMISLLVAIICPVVAGFILWWVYANVILEVEDRIIRRLIVKNIIYLLPLFSVTSLLHHNAVRILDSFISFALILTVSCIVALTFRTKKSFILISISLFSDTFFCIFIAFICNIIGNIRQSFGTSGTVINASVNIGYFLTSLIVLVPVSAYISIVFMKRIFLPKTINNIVKDEPTTENQQEQ